MRKQPLPKDLVNEGVRNRRIQGVPDRRLQVVQKVVNHLEVEVPSEICGETLWEVSAMEYLPSQLTWHQLRLSKTLEEVGSSSPEGQVTLVLKDKGEVQAVVARVIENR